MLAPLVLPKALSAVAEELTRAVREVPIIGTWPEGEAFQTADQPQAIARALIHGYHTHLGQASIAYLYREQLERGGRVRLGVAQRASAKLRYLSEFDFILEFNWQTWNALSPPQRIALVDHELCHCVRDDEGRYGMRRHDVEEFSEIVGRWGLWTPDLRMFNLSANNAQVDLFKDVAANVMDEAAADG
jgi:hypothetical protein